MGTIEDSKLENVAETALQSGKSVLYFGDASINEKLTSLSALYRNKINIYDGTPHNSVLPTVDSDKFKYTDMPTVLVGGLVAEADTFEVLLRLIARLRADGLCVTGITRHPLGELFGLHTLNHILDRKDIPEAEKILELNRFVRRLETAERPSIILMEAPDAVIKFNNYAPNGFGIHTYMLC